MTDSPSSDRRTHARGRDRRREAWRAFRHAYPTFLRVSMVLFLLLVAFDFWLWHRREDYSREIGRLRATMTDAEREKSDVIVQSEQDKLRMALELAKHQARWDPQLHLSIAVDSGRMYLERNGALLREMHADIAPAPVPPGVTPVSVKRDSSGAEIRPRGERTIAEVRSDSGLALVLTGGARIYGSGDSSAVTPGDVRVSPADLKAILPNVAPGMVVYFY